MRIAITGASGFIGTALRGALAGRGDEVVRVVRRSPEGPDEVSWSPREGTIDAAGLAGIDAVVHLAGASIGGRRWTKAYKARIRDSRVRGTELIARTIADLTPHPKVLVSASAVGVYGDRGDETLAETSEAGSGFLAELCRAWESATAPAAGVGIRVVSTRSGIVLGEGGGLLPLMALPFRFGVGGPVASGEQWMSWIALDDHIAAILHLLDSTLSGPVNLTAPNPVTNEDFSRTLARVLRRPCFLRVPAFVVRLALGEEMARETLLGGQRVLPQRIVDDGFAFRHPELEGALRAALGRPAPTGSR